MVIAAVCSVAVSAFAQAGSFTISGRVKIEGGGLDGTKVVVYRNGQKDRAITNNLSKFSLELDLGQNYELSFEKDGFVTKKLSFDTRAPAEAIANGFTPFEFAVSLFKQYDDVNTVVFNQPVGMIRYDATLDDFDYDTDYTKSIQSQLQKAQEEVAKKQKEEAEQEAVEARRKAEEEKLKAKAEAEAKAKEAEAAKAQARQQKEQEEAARKAEAERQKAELAARKAEEQRLAEESRTAKEAAKPAPKPKPQPVPKPDPPAPVAKADPPKPKPQPAARVEAPRPVPPAPTQHNGLAAKSHDGSEPRRSAAPRQAAEASPVRKAAPVAKAEERPAKRATADEVVREEELIVEPNQVVTVVRLGTDAQKAEYRKVVRKYGATHYFKNGQPCTQLVYEREAHAENR